MPDHQMLTIDVPVPGTEAVARYKVAVVNPWIDSTVYRLRHGSLRKITEPGERGYVMHLAQKELAG